MWSQGGVARLENAKYCDDVERVTSCSTRYLAYCDVRDVRVPGS